VVSGVPADLHPLVEALADPARLASAAGLRPGVGARAAAVLVLIGEGPQGLEMVFVERATTLRTHAGQIAFPGGAADPDDRDLAATALREAAEEIGVDPAGVDVLGSLPPVHVAVSGFDVTAVVGWWRRRSAVGVADPGEVASVVVVPVVDLVDPGRRARVRHPLGYTGPAFQVAGHLIWGLTAHLVDSLLNLAGWQRSWDTERRVEIPARYLQDRRTSDQMTGDSGGPDAH
jgi:8-oxo-dGTP pyrophosphatase MutT (NUDIX family)